MQIVRRGRKTIVRVVPRQTTENGRKDCGGEMGVSTVPSGAVTTVCDRINHCTEKCPPARIALIALEMLPSLSQSAVMAVT